MIEYIPFAPWANVKLPEGIYRATVQKITQQTFGQTDEPMLRLVFHLPLHDVFFVSNLYMPATFSQRCQQRLWYLSQSLGVEPHDLLETPATLYGRSLALDIMTVTPERANGRRPYADVRRFLPIEALPLENDNNGSASTAMDV